MVEDKDIEEILMRVHRKVNQEEQLDRMEGTIDRIEDKLNVAFNRSEQPVEETEGGDSGE